MSDLDANIHGYSYGAVHGPTQVETTENSESKTNNSTVSTIEQSKVVASLMIPPPNFPALVSPPANGETSLVLVVSSMNNSSQPILAFMRSMQEQTSKIMDEMLDGWLKNIKEIDEYVQRLINSPQYLALQDIRLNGDPKQGNVAGIQDPTSANAAAANPTTANVAPYTFLNSLDRLNKFERVAEAASASESSPASDAARQVTLTLISTMIIGGAMSLGATELTTSIDGVSSSPFVGPVELLEKLQPVFPQLVIQDMIPMINLMVASTFYATALDEAVSNAKEREGENHVEAAQNFARDVIKMVADPAFVAMTYVNKMEGADQMSPELKERMAALVKLVLASVALSLLYTVEVGKVQSGKYWGMEPQEFRDLLNGTIPVKTSGSLTAQEQMVATLLNQIKAQLDILPAEERIRAIETILDYVGESHHLEGMLDPGKVFHETFNPKDPTKDPNLQAV
ncbi:hypothetical protein [Candidatus Protochlamydia sp. R18]|uniref:hypothetical protein n=1 Tax=Candidatus Protochlamydia sp. R18 TaxID=1353977 RepID=UPI0005A7E6CF|nr:hypothetical protein [Candidatus Protochlamydia sp. R18]